MSSLFKFKKQKTEIELPDELEGVLFNSGATVYYVGKLDTFINKYPVFATKNRNKVVAHYFSDRIKENLRSNDWKKVGREVLLDNKGNTKIIPYDPRED
jgi:Tol biopolymer transport system component